MTSAQILAARVVLADRFNLAADSKRFTCKMIEPGLVSYRDQPGGGLELLRKETIDRCLQSALGNPLTIKHVTVTRENLLEIENGAVDKVSYNEADGWYYCEGDVRTNEAQSLMRRGQKPSCAYAVLGFGPGGTYHGIKYDREITDIDFQHLAIVEKPRYEDATFRLNSASQSNMKSPILKFLRTLVTRSNDAAGTPVETKKVESVDVSADTTVEVDGQQVRLNDLVSAWVAAKGSVFTASGEDQVEIEGCGPVKMNELVACYKNAAAARKNAADEEEKKKKDAETARQNEAAAADAQKKKDEETARVARENAAAEDAKKKKEGTDAFFTLRHARENAALADEAAARALRSPNSGSIIDRVAEGQKRYGSTVVVAGKN